MYVTEPVNVRLVRLLDFLFCSKKRIILQDHFIRKLKFEKVRRPIISHAIASTVTSVHFHSFNLLTNFTRGIMNI
jgi:hypothetical protein